MSWWCVAWSEGVKDKPVPARVYDQELVLFRDAAGVIKACEDRCPHRRVPLSMGWVTAKGTIQCGYHGWAYDGGSGQCVEIPNFRPNELISPRVKVRVFAVAEEQGAIFVRLDSPSAPTDLKLPQLARISSSSTDQIELPLPHAQWIECLVADPLRALGLDFQATREERHVEGDGSLVIELPSRGPNQPAMALTTRLEVWAQTGLSQLTVRQDDGPAVFEAVISSLPLDANRTLVRWKSGNVDSSGALGVLIAKFFASPKSGIHIRPSELGRSGQSGQAATMWRNLPAGGRRPDAQTRMIEEG